MRNSSKKILSFLVILSLFLACLISLKVRGRSISNRESFQIISEFYSPDSKYKATVFLDGGNATVSNSIKVTVTKSYKKKIYESDIIFVQARVNAVDVRWDSNSDLKIIYNEDEFSDIFKQVNTLHHVNISYDKIATS